MKRIISLLLSVLFVLTSFNCFAITSAKALDSRIENALQWAVGIANDNSHGYSWDGRWGPDYDCSSLVITAFKNAGFNVDSATYTGNMRTVFEEAGFTWIPKSQINLINSSQLQSGDILLDESSHTEIYLGNGQNVGAHRGYMSQWCSHSNSDGKYHRHGHYSLGEQKGDQDGGEISVAGYYNYPWDGVLRYTPKEPEHWYKDLEFVDLGECFSAYIQHKNTGMYLSGEDDKIYGQEQQNNENHKWNFTRMNNGAYVINNVGNGKYMDVWGSGTNDNTVVHLYNECTYENNQQFFIYEINGSYYFKPLHTDKVLDMKEVPDYNLTIWTQKNEHTPQMFDIQKYCLHNFILNETVSQTCTESGTKTFTCTVCGDTYTETIPATGHKVVIDVAVPPTYIESGLTQGKHCENCGEVLVPQEKAEPLVLFGDANGDGEVNIQDATLVQMYVAKYKVDNFNEKLADYDQSGGVNIQDATAIQMKVAKLA